MKNNQLEIFHTPCILLPYLTALLCLISGHVLGQLDTTYTLPLVVKTEDLGAIEIVKELELDSAILAQYQNSSLAEILASQTPLFIKNYGSGNLATISFRGMGASHTQIYWNDIPMNSPMLGQVDMNLMPVAFGDKLSVTYGSSDMEQGSGALGGGVRLNNEADYKNTFRGKLTQSVSSINNFQTTGQVDYGNARVQGSTRILLGQGRNAYRFRDKFSAGLPIVKEDHADFSSHGFLQSVYFRPENNTEIEVHSWYQENDRNLPPSANQEDKTWRSVLKWKRVADKSQWKISAAYLKDWLVYSDENTNLYSDSKSERFYHQFDYTYALSPQTTIQGGWTILSDIAETEAYGQRKHTQQIGAYIAIDALVLDRLKIHARLREERNSGEYSPVMYAVGLTGQPIKNQAFFVKMNHSRNFRYPTLNDRYWVPGGNRDLRPEVAMNLDMSLAYERQLKAGWKLGTELTAYHTMVDDWVQWSPTTAGYWQAQNLKKVQSDGLELEFKTKQTKRLYYWSLSSMYAWARVKNVATLGVQSNIVGKSLIYVPAHQWKNYAQLGYKKVNFSFSHVLTGKRFTTTDNDKSLPAYHIGNVSLQYAFDIRKLKTAFQFEVHNLWNVDYAVVENRPMPLRYYSLLWRIGF